MDPRPVLIAGGGIGGLTAALALARAGLPVRLFEQASAFGEVGAGIQLGPNAMRVLAALGLGPAVEAVAFEPEAAEIRHGVTGLTLFRLPLGQAARARWGAPYLQIHRADLLALLLEALRTTQAELRTGTRVTGYDQTEHGVTALLADGSRREGQALIGADGIGSAIQAEMLGPETARFTGNVCWRATLEADALPPGLVAPRGTIWAGTGRHLVTYPLRRGRLVNLVAVIERPGWQREGWTEPGDPAELRAAFRGWHSQVTGLLAHVGECYLWALRDRAPLPRWSQGRVTLLGDACHPMLPFLAQGAAMAIEDAACLAACLACSPVPEALARYQSLRLPRAARLQRAARRNGRLFHRSGPLAQTAAFAPMALATRLAPRTLTRAFDWLYGHDATRV